MPCQLSQLTTATPLRLPVALPRQALTMLSHRSPLSFLVALLMVSLFAAPAILSTATAQVPAGDVLADDPSLAAKLQAELMSEIRQLTFDGKRAGEGYFSADGKQIVFQSEREPGNPFFQIYTMDRENGDVHRVSPGIGKTTCAWIHPDGERVMYASTQFDPAAEQKQVDEIAFRASGEKRRYTWDYDPAYDLVVFNSSTNETQRLTNAEGYDAEGSYSPDGEWICFASNRRAYAGELTEEEQSLFEHDPASAMDLYRMRSDGSQVERLTSTIGYDGGPFYSPDGKQICFRRFSRDGVTAEIMLMNADGSNQRAITQLKHMSWAPFFHPSGDYLIFATNVHGFGNFELYLVDAAGQQAPVRVTYRDGFDGLPVFDPTGGTLLWTSNGGGSQSQLFEAQWNDAHARELLGLGEQTAAAASTHGQAAESSADENSDGETSAADAASLAEAAQSAKLTAPGFLAADVGRHIDYLCRPELGGRLTGTPGERLATAYVAAYLESLGLQPAGRDGTFFHEFEFVADVELGKSNAIKLTRVDANEPNASDAAQNASDAAQQTSAKPTQASVQPDAYTLDEDWRPVFFSQEGRVDPTAIVFAGYGIVAPAETAAVDGESDADRAAYDSYVHLDVTDKWVLVFRQMPQDITPERRQHLARYSGARYKAMVARDRGARGLIFVSGPTSPLRSRLMPLEMDGTLGGSSLAVLSVADAVAEEWLKGAGEDLRELQTSLDQGEMAMGFELPGIRLEAHIDIEPITATGRNVLACLPGYRADDSASAAAALPMVVVGAHIDHLGAGSGAGSLAKEDERGGVHRGADDNASGVAGMLEIAQYLAGEMQPPRPVHKHDILFAAWSGEELGLRGSQAFADDFAELYPDRKLSSSSSLQPAVVANLNMDMIGRLRDSLVLQGIGSSAYWAGAIERRNAVVRLSLTLQDDCHLPTDASTFFLNGVPILSAFTGSHDEYHTPRDVPELINYEGTAQVARLIALIARDLVMAEQAPEYQEQEAEPQMRANLTAYLGTVPDYAQSDLKGVKLAGVTKGAPADLAGLQAGDVIVELAGRKIENIYDYTYAIEALKVGQETSVKIQRGPDQLKLALTPASRQ